MFSLEKWYCSPHRKPLLVRGARQVGKSTLVRLFSSEQKLKLYEVNLEINSKLNSVFQTKNVDLIIQALEDHFEEKISPEQSLLFFDEIQETPALIPALRYLYELKPDLAIIGAGSLLEFTLDDHDYSMPLGRIEFLHMGPMNFTEFLIAHNKTYLAEELVKKTEISETIHEKLLGFWKEYLFVGGMPEAVLNLVQGREDEVTRTHARILQTYQFDFVKYASKKHLDKIQIIFNRAMQRPCTKVKYSNLLPDEGTRETKKNLDLLCKAKIFTKVFHTNSWGIPVESGAKEDVFKLLALDIGLVNHLAGLQKREILRMQEDQILTSGAMGEQFVGQELLSIKNPFLEPKLHYWLREGKSSNAEVDYIIQRGSVISAIEVKSGSVGKMRSLHQWYKSISYPRKEAIRFNLSRGGEERVQYQYEDDLLQYELKTLPIYAVQRLI
jgi:predicted AAA+ superfamily ATPase